MRDPADCRRADPPPLPVISGSRWFEPEGRPFIVRIEVPLAFDEMVAALYGVAEPGDITGDHDLIGTVTLEGLPALAERAARIRRDEQRGAIESPAFRALCRQRVAALLVP